MSASNNKNNKSNLRRFNTFSFISTFARALVEIFIALYLFKNGFTIQSIMLFYVLENLLSLAISYFYVLVGERFSYTAVMYMGIASFVVLQMVLSNLSHDFTYIFLISVLYALYRRGYWVARRFYITKIMPEKNSSVPYSVTVIVTEMATVLAGFLGGLLLDSFSAVNLMIISSVLLVISVWPLWKIEGKGKNTKIELIKHLKRFDKKNIVAFSIYEINNLLTFLFPIYVFLYIKDTYMMNGLMDVVSDIAILVFVFLYGRIIKKRNFFILSTILFVLVCLAKLFVLNYFILVICFIEGIIKKMQNQSLSKIYFENRNGTDLAHYNLIYQALESFTRVVVTVPLLFMSDVRMMILFVLLFISVELVIYAFLKKRKASVEV